LPSENQGSSSTDRARFPDLRDHLGEDPARFLDQPLFGTHSNPGRLMRDRIRGIDEVEVVRAWRAVERNLDRGPRDKVLEWLDEREDELEEIGDRPDRLSYGPRRPPEMLDTESAISIDDGETAHQKVQQLRADGGES